jgi:hypothetical protein
MPEGMEQAGQPMTALIVLTVFAIWFALGFVVALGMAMLRQAARNWDELAARQRHPTAGPRSCPPRPRRGAYRDECKG